MKKNSLKVSAFFLVALLVFTGCRTGTVYNVQKNTVHTSYNKMQRAILSAGTSLGWKMSRVKHGEIRGKLALRSHVAVARIRYTGHSYSIRYVKSSNLKYNAQKGTIHSNYNGWVQNLERAIDSQLIMSR